ncbi:GDCCVxC domain-containing (seleno)protein [Thiosulfatihalobacter marinus]|uniref:GDCCVxC domain-containing (seleno)protein n=1 Tax=Thiosulfatihalobacter marinus TaxID=2792481 RepID=UPI001E3CF20A|nr:GDCCVxC domain-containing (seleno)protein [Thiosulfatihalobacter marinus]
MLLTRSLLTCPKCGHEETFEMPTDSCQYFLECPGCKALLKPLAGDCCVFCSYGTAPCPPVQSGAGCCGDDA